MSEENKNTEAEQPAENIPKEIIAVDETHIPKSAAAKKTVEEMEKK